MSRHPKDGNRSSRRRPRWRASYEPRSPVAAIPEAPAATSRAAIGGLPLALSRESRFRLPVLGGGRLRRSFARLAANSRWPKSPALRRSTITVRPHANKANPPVAGPAKRRQVSPPSRRAEPARLILFQLAPPIRG